MPLAKLYLPTHLPQPRAAGLADAVHHALVSTCGVPPTDRFQLVLRLAPEAMHLDPQFPNVSRSADASIVEIAFLCGRSDAQKRNLYRAIADGAAAAGWRTDDVMVALLENGRADWSLGLGEAYADVAAAH